MMRSTLSVAAALVVLAGAGCIHHTEPVKLANRTPVAIAFVADAETGGDASDVPSEVKDAIVSELATRNIDAQPLDASKVEPAFQAIRASERRLEWLKEQSPQTPYVLLVETRARFFSQISGRYRWTVLAKLTALGRDSKAAPTTRDYEEGVVLQFDHERAPQATALAAPRIAETAGALFDDLLAAPPPSSASPSDSPKPETAPGSAPATQLLPQPGAIYFVMVDRFANGDPSNDGAVDPKDPAAFHGGDLQGVIDHLDELKSLGVETLWLSPIFKMRTEKFFGYGAFHGYWVYDLNQVEPRFGDRRLLRRLSDELHQRGMKLLLDVALNHVGPDAPLVQQKPEWFHKKGPLEHWDNPEEVETHDVHGLPDLAQENPEVYAYLLNASLGWIRDVKPDGFRLDAVKHMPLSFWRKYTADVRKVAGDDFILLGEMLEGDPTVLARTERDGGFNAIFDFPVKFATEDVVCKDQPATRLATTLSLDRIYDRPESLVTLADNHDLPRIVTACGGDLEKVKQVLTVIAAVRGTPSLMWGTESALTGAKEPENRADMRFDAQPLRPVLARLFELRREFSSLTSGAPWLLEASAARFVMARVGHGDAALLVVNRSGSAIDVAVPEALRGDWHDGLSNAGIGDAVHVAPHAVALAVGRAKALSAFDATYAVAEQLWKPRGSGLPVTFSVRGTSDKPGDVVHVIGGAPELGAWSPEKAPAIEADAHRAVVRLPPGFYEYKLVITHAAGAPTWEDGGNRILQVPQPSTEASFVSAVVTWGRPDADVKTNAIYFDDRDVVPGAH